MAPVPNRLVKATSLALVSLLVSGCSQALFAIANAPARFASVDRSVNVAYGDGPRRRLDVYAPRRAKGLPVVVFWYGGAWTEGKKEDYRFVGATLAQHGFVAVLPDYRLYPEVKYPEFIKDGAQAVAWVEQHADAIGGDRSRIVLMGHSAGAYMAAMLALDPKYIAAAGANAADIIGFVGLSGPYVLQPDTADLRAIFSSPYLPVDWQPVHYAHPHSPPGLLVHGLEDRRVLPAQARQLRDALAARQSRVEMELYEHCGHADTVAAFSAFKRQRLPIEDRVFRFLANITRSSGQM